MDHQETFNRLSQLKENDRVKVIITSGLRQRIHIERVTSVTPTLVRTPGREWYKSTGYSRGFGFGSRLAGLATAEEIKAWDDEQKREAEKREQEQTARNERMAKLNELNAIQRLKTSGPDYYVHDADIGDGTFSLTFDKISEEQVRKILDKVFFDLS